MATKKKATIEQPAPEVTEEIEGTDELARRKVILKLKHVDVKFNVRGRKLNAIRDANLEIFEGETLAGSSFDAAAAFAAMDDPPTWFVALRRWLETCGSHSKGKR